MLINLKRVFLRDGRSIDLRSPEPAEAALLLAHLRIVFRESYRNMNYPADHFDTFPEEKETEILQSFATSSNQFMISAFHGNQIVGNLGCFGKSGEFLKHSASIGMGINKEFCGAGLGTEMLEYAVESARRNGLHRLELTVRAFNLAGIKLYEKCKFEQVGRLKEVAYIDGEYLDEFYFERLL